MARTRLEALDELEQEFIGERANALGRVARRMERALAALREFGRAEGEQGHDRAGREELVAAAGEAVWCYLVQRESLGLHRNEEALRSYEVPDEVRLRMGPRTTRAPKAR